MRDALNSIRLSHYFLFFVVFYAALSILIPSTTLERGALTLFSVNSFLFGFYISPIFSGQKKRIDDIHRMIRIEASHLYSIALWSKKLEKDAHHAFVQDLSSYSESAYANRDVQGEQDFEKLMGTLISYAGKQDAVHREIMKSSFKLQENRSEINRLLNEKVYRNEWIVMMILFSITISFILLIELPDVSYVHFIPPILCAGLTMLMVILAKMSMLSHKRALSIWEPLNNLPKSRFYRVNEA